MFSAGQLGDRAIHLSGKPLKRSQFTLRMSGSYREELAKKAGLTRWVLGDGGKSGTHCPICVERAELGWVPVKDLPDEPGDGNSYCEDACSCRKEYQAPDFQTVHYPAEGPAPRAQGTR